MLVECETLASYRYLEDGAFYAIIALAVMMFLNAVSHVSEIITGLIEAGFIVCAFFDSVRYNRRTRARSAVLERIGAPIETLKTQTTSESARSASARPKQPSRPE